MERIDASSGFSSARFARRGIEASSIAGVLLAAALLVSGSAHAAASDQIVRSVEGFARTAEERGGATLRELKEQRTAAADVVSKPRALPSSSVTLGDQWIYDADAVVYDDYDDDGYYRYLSVRFDADTYLASAWVYAVLYLSADGEVWEEYYATDDFLIGGTVADDEYYVETELVAGYPTGLYDVLIELYDADFGTFSDEFGPNESPALGLLPLEDASYDVPPVAVAISTGSGGGGAMSLLVLPALLLVRRRLAAAAGIRRHPS